MTGAEGKLRELRESLAHYWSLYWTWLAGDSSYESGDESIVLRALAERRDEIEREERRIRPPTFQSASGCMDCGVIQTSQENGCCSLCGSEELLNLSLVLQRMGRRMGRKPAANHVRWKG